MKNTNNTITINQANVKSVVRIALIATFVVILLVVGLSSWFTVNDQQQAVVTTFGKVTRVCDAGIHFKIPLIQQVHKIDVNVRQKMELGYRSDERGNPVKVVDEESKMITGDYNIVNIDFFIEYRISDPVKYLFNSKDPEMILTNLLQSQVRNVVGSTNVDDVLTHGKNAIQSAVKELTVQELTKYDIGLTVYSVTIQDSEPPNEEVFIAFKNVQTASQLAEKVINEARAYHNAKLPNAEAEADKLKQNSEYLKTNRINEARMQIAMFEAIYQEYSLNPHITKTRMYYEMIREVLPSVKIFIDVSGNGDTLKLLPLDGLS